MTTPTPTPNQAADAELETVAYLVTGLARGEPSLCFEDERGDYGDEDHTPVFEALVRKSDYDALLAQLEEQRAVSARMEADARRLDWLADKSQAIGNVQLPRACVERHPDSLRAAIDMAMRIER
ncbi:hypothetical protein VLK31_34700 [Variovorax sp. H27-G14]|uniref:hypothetical protein n=1 Tax=Variovorax sp. H27-G14 TaxID=3111914 RepID=UPI0038FD251A